MELCEGGEVDEGDAEGWMGLRVERYVCEQGTWGGGGVVVVRVRV